MKTAIRILVAFLAFVASYLVIYWVPFSMVPWFRNSELVPRSA